MENNLVEKLNILHKEGKHQEIIDMIEALPAEQLSAELISELGREF